MYTPQLMPRSSHYGSNYIPFYSRKLKRDVTCYSQLEYANALFLECDSKIRNYCEQPLIIEGIYKGKKLKTTFDFWLEDINSQEEFHEVKHSKALIPGNRGYENAQKQIYLQREWCLDRNKRYLVRTEQNFKMDSYFYNNIKAIYTLVSSRPDDVETEILNTIMQYISIQPRTIKEIMNYTNASQQEIFESISWLMYKGRCTGNLDSRLIDFKTIITSGGIEFS